MSDPWKSLERPDTAGAINARRVDEIHPWGFFWARDIEGRALLVLRYEAASAPVQPLPNMKGIEVFTRETGESGGMLVLRLLDSGHRDIFRRLCDDIVDSARKAPEEPQAVGIALARTWRWHHLLRGGSDGRLSLEEQKGLIGELLVLERHLLAHLDAVDAVTAWTGPSDAPKDFEIGTLAIEAKARRGAATPYVSISSEHQLDDSPVEQLFLHVVDLAAAPPAAADTFTLESVVLRVQEAIEAADPGALVLYDSRLASAGFDWDDDYSQEHWLEGDSRVFRVAGDFPRLTGPMVPTGIGRVKYALDLHACEPYRVAASDIDDALIALQQGAIS